MMIHPRDTYLVLRAFVDELARCGLREACTSPGSRSTPLVLTLAGDERLRSTSIIDERSAGFFAVGLAKASGRPVALACTSGTAAANYAPAVHEAHEARVPLLVLTADRPPELREIGAGQTVDQVKLYGGAAKWYFEIDAAPASAERMRWIRQLACRAYWTTLDGRPGPVQLNFSFREPLVLDHALDGSEPGGGGLEGGRPWVTRPRVHAAPAASTVEGLAAELKARPRAVLVAGRQERDPKLGEVLAELAERAKIPLLADPLPGAGRGPAAIAHYDALLRDPDWAEEHAPELVIRIGDLPTSKPLRQWLHGLDGALQVTLDAENAWQDPGGAVGTILGGDPRATLEALGAHVKRRTDPSWLERFRRADHAAAGAIAHVLGAAGLSEPRVAAELGARLPEAATLFVASSMPVRDVETFFPARHAPPRVLSNRGANGIDGTVSSAFGVAAAARGPVVLLIGDVALAHDVGGLLANARQRLKVTIVLLDNDGGGIFDFLPVRAAAPADAYTEHISTPHGLDFSHAAALYGLGFEHAEDMDGFRDALERAFGADGSSIVHVRT